MWPFHKHDWVIREANHLEVWADHIDKVLSPEHGRPITRVLYQCSGCEEFRTKDLPGTWTIRKTDAEETALKRITGV